MPSFTERTNVAQTEALQTMITEMQRNLQQQLQKQQQDFQTHIESLMVGKGKASDTALPAADKASTSTPPGLENQLQDVNTSQENGLNIRNGTNEPLHPPSQVPRFPHPHHSQYVKEPSYPRSYLNTHTPPPASSQNPHTKIKASDLPKFKGDKGEDVETWIEQLSAIFQANRCSDLEIVAFLSVILKDTALKWFTRLGVKGRSQFVTWMDWQDALRQRFLKANYFAEKKRLWKKRDLRSNEDIADYFDAKVDLQAYVFDASTPESELILDILDGLPDYMLPTPEELYHSGYRPSRFQANFA
jgi:hypothetical protein